MEKKIRYIPHIWLACIGCGKERWVDKRTTKSSKFTGLCTPCRNRREALTRLGINHPNWKGGRGKTKDGYITIRGIHSDNFFFPMVNRQGSIHEHRLVMAKYLGRCLLPWEIIHHKNGIRDDNRLENLSLLNSQLYHLPSIIAKREFIKLRKRIAELEKRVILLEAENALYSVSVQEAVD